MPRTGFWRGSRDYGAAVARQGRREEEDDQWARVAVRQGRTRRRQVGPVGRGWRARVTRLSGERERADGAGCWAERTGKRGRAGGKEGGGGGLGHWAAGRGRGKAGPAGELRFGPGWDWYLGWFSSLFPFFFFSSFLFPISYFKHYSNLIEFKFEFEFKPHSTKNKLCTSMNAQTSST